MEPNFCILKADEFFNRWHFIFEMEILNIAYAESNKERVEKLTTTIKDLLFLACVAFCVITFEPIMI